MDIYALLRKVGYNLNDIQIKVLKNFFKKIIDESGSGGDGGGSGDGGDSGDGSCCKKVVLTRAEYTMLANANELDEDTLYLVLEAQTETITSADDPYDLRSNTYTDLTIDVLQPSSSNGGGGSVVA